MITKAKLALVGKIFAFIGFLTLETVIGGWIGVKFGGWIGGKFGGWIAESILEVTDKS